MGLVSPALAKARPSADQPRRGKRGLRASRRSRAAGRHDLAGAARQQRSTPSQPLRQTVQRMLDTIGAPAYVRNSGSTCSPPPVRSRAARRPGRHDPPSRRDREFSGLSRRPLGTQRDCHGEQRCPPLAAGLVVRTSASTHSKGRRRSLVLALQHSTAAGRLPPRSWGHLAVEPLARRDFMEPRADARTSGRTFDLSTDGRQIYGSAPRPSFNGEWRRDRPRDLLGRVTTS